MKPILKSSDYKKIKVLISDLPRQYRTREIGELQMEMEKATIVPDENIEADIIQVNSYFEVTAMDSDQRICYSLVLPSDADLEKKKISIFSRLGVALIGFREGMEIEWKLPGGIKKFKIEKVLQPLTSPL
ncbi:MAG TPA: GreA/GreB family elongation factor [Lunatimonas sp.]|nr:GreA/GreB family elongation factor [Lunatimonas sp.]